MERFYRLQKNWFVRSSKLAGDEEWQVSVRAASFIDLGRARLFSRAASHAWLEGSF
jgi:hypothetical protein